MRGLVVVAIIAFLALSLAWTTWKSRQVLGRALGRKLRRGEETSIRSWMEVPSDALDSALRELDKNPFDRVLNEAPDPFGSSEAGRRADKTLDES